jgi:GntR family transcriptional regulator, transcriptional repressor for pyruvate dehydrogenase complex
VSRVSIRQALTVLETMGLIERRVGEGTYSTQRRTGFAVTPLVNRLTSQKYLVLEPLEVRRMIEPQIARLAAERASKEDQEEMEHWLRKQEEKISRGELITIEDNKFHYAIAAATKNKVTVLLVEALNDMFWESREQSISASAGSLKSYEGHVRVYDAIRARDGERAYQAMLEHLQEVEKLILSGAK